MLRAAPHSPIENKVKDVCAAALKSALRIRTLTTLQSIANKDERSTERELVSSPCDHQEPENAEKSMIFKTNVGLTDRSIRTLLGIGLLAFAMSGDQTGFEWFGWIGVIPLATGLVGSCPLYSLFGINTRGI